MPNRERYRRQSGEQTTIWITKAAKARLDLEREDGESTTSLFDRLLQELRGYRRKARAGIGAPRR